MSVKTSVKMSIESFWIANLINQSKLDFNLN